MLTGYVAEQAEPLGQSVAVTDPEAPFEPQTYEQHLFFASDPEWQCNLPVSFQPVSCSIRAEIASAEVDFGGTLRGSKKKPKCKKSSLPPRLLGGGKLLEAGRLLG